MLSPIAGGQGKWGVSTVQAMQPKKEVFMSHKPISMVIASQEWCCINNSPIPCVPQSHIQGLLVTLLLRLKAET